MNAVGLSRGGIACSYLAHAMADIPASRPSTSFSYSKMISRRSHQREQNLQIWSEASFCLIFVGQTSYPAKTINEDVFPIENGDFQKITWEKKTSL